jgi:glycosyltransferase involved in cell wall biosynthesis
MLTSQQEFNRSENTGTAPADGKKVSVIHLIHSMAYGGVDAIVIDWLRTIDRDRFDVQLVCFANPGGTERPFADAARAQGLEVATIPWARRKPVFSAARALARLARARGAQIIHTHNVYADVVGLVAARWIGAKAVATLYVWGDFGFKRNVLQHVDRLALQFFDRITTQCEMTYRQTLERGLPEARTSVLASGMEVLPLDLVDPIERARRRRELGASDEHTVLVNVARLYPEKAQDLLLRAFKQVVARCPTARLWVLGVGPLEEQLKAQCAELGLDDTVRFLGFVTDLPEFLRLVDIQVHPSLNEGVPIALGAGMEAGLPIVATAVGGVPEVLDHGRSGVLIPAGDEAALVEAVVDLVTNPDRARQLGAEARRFVEDRYSLAASVAKLERLYAEMV